MEERIKTIFCLMMGWLKDLSANNHVKNSPQHTFTFGEFISIFPTPFQNDHLPPVRSLALWDDQWSEMLDFGLKQNPKYATSVDKKQN